MPKFAFNPDSGFDENLKAFLEHMEAQDAELGALLKVHGALLNVSTAEAKKARNSFNTAIKQELDKTLSAPAPAPVSHE